MVDAGSSGCNSSLDSGVPVEWRKVDLFRKGVGGVSVVDLDAIVFVWLFVVLERRGITKAPV